MKEIKLDKLQLSNFKGIKDLTVEFGKLTNIFGDNATGKTTIFDAFTWLLFDKDSLNRKDFGIKTYDGQGDTLHGVDHSVEGLLEIDGQPIHLKKTYSEIWTKKRGKTDAEFSGHTTEYQINDVPVKKSEYDSRIQSIIPEEQFKLLTNPLYFNETLDKKQRRDIILSLENISDEDVLYTFNTPPIALIEKLKNYTVDEIKAMAKATMKKLNHEIEDLPVRIDELSHQLVNHNWDALEKEKKEKQSELNLLSGQIDDVQKIIQTANEKARSLASKIHKLDEIERKNDRDYLISVDEAGRARKEAQRKEEDRLYSIKRIEQDIVDIKNRISRLEKTREDLLENWASVNASEPPTKKMCEYCGQLVPADQLQEIIKTFNLNKSKRLEDIVNLGKEQKKKIDEEKEKLDSMTSRLNELQQTVVEIPEEQPVVKPELPVEWHQLKAEIDADEKRIKEEQSVPNELEMRLKKARLSQEISELDELLGQRKRNASIEARIAELKDSEKDLARSYEEQEKLLNESEDFIKAKVSLISGKINAHFKQVEFKLFDVLINGGINETCEVMVRGVPYSDVNNAGKINAGLDVINTLQRVYGVSAPIFVDNAESVNSLNETNSQLIRLIVSQDQTLKIEEK